MLRSTSAAAVEKALDGLAMRMSAIAGNLANAETPGFRPQRVVFEQALRAAIDRERTAPTLAARGTAIRDVTPAALRRFLPGADPVGVEPELELTELARASLHYEALARTAAKQLRMLRAAITGGAQQ